MPVMRPCLDCGCRISTGTRCAGCALTSRVGKRTPEQERRHTAARAASRFPESVRRAALTRAAGVCELCHGAETPGDPLQVDHVIPVVEGGQPVLENARAIHRSHNAAAGARLGNARRYQP